MPSERDVPDGHTPLAAVGSEGDTAGMLTPGILSAGSCAEQEAETREAGSYPEMVAPGRPSLRPGLCFLSDLHAWAAGRPGQRSRGFWYGGQRS